MITTKVIFLVHGIDDTGVLFHRLRARLEEKGWAVHAIDLVPNDGTAGIDELAQQIARYLEGRLPVGDPVNLVGFSMGGLAARCYTQRLAGRRKVSKLITVSAPHAGTWTAFLRRNIGSSQMRPGSRFLRDLNDEDSLRCLQDVDFTCIWSPLDLMIIPANSSVIAKARSVRVRVWAHALMMRNRSVIQLIEDALAC